MRADDALSTPISTDHTEGDGLKHRILELAIGMFAGKGYAATSTRELVEAAGCTKPALYYHFQNKEGLFRAAVEHASRRLDCATDIPEAAAVAMGFRECLRQSLARVATHVTDYPDDLRLLFRAESYAALGSDLHDARPLRAAHLQFAEELLRAGIESGEVRPDLPVEDAAISLMGMLHFELELWLDGRPLPDDFADRIVSIYMDGVTR